jgi:hypothetical protein
VVVSGMMAERMFISCLVVPSMPHRSNASWTSLRQGG